MTSLAPDPGYNGLDVVPNGWAVSIFVGKAHSPAPTLSYRTL